jgi:hypothetical protein
MVTEQRPNDSFRFLQARWPDLHDLGQRAEQAATREPILAAIHLRGLTEKMVRHLFDRMGISWNRASSHFDRLVLLQKEDLLDARLLAKFHAIRKLGNHAAHNRPVAPEQVESLLEDAWSLGCWFCRFMCPDLEWLIPPRAKGNEATPIPVDEGDLDPAARQSTASGTTGQVLNFPEERIRRIRDTVAQAMSQVDPRVRQLRTRMTLAQAFGEELTDDQKGCVAALESFLADDKRRIFLLKGYAGTGKTFLAKGLTEFFLAQGRSFRMAAPTGRAAKVISEKTGQEARTLHGLIYNYGDLKEYSDGVNEPGAETFKFYAGISPNHDRANTVYIVDEASMVSDVYSESEFFRSGSGYLLQDLFEYLSFHQSDNDRKLIFLGDPAQLPPVGMTSSPALDAAYLRGKFGLEATEYELKEVVRQKAESGVLRNALPLREGLATGTFGGLSIAFGDDVIRTEPDEVLSLYLQARQASNPNAAILITHTNSEAAGYNRAIRGRLFPGRDFVAAGDRLIVTANTFLGGHFLANGEFVEVLEAETAVESRSVTLRRHNRETGRVETQEVTLTFRDLRLAVPLLDGEEMVVDAKVLDDHLHGNLGGLTPKEQTALYIDFKRRHPQLRPDKDRELFRTALRQDPYFNALRTKFGYAVTCHKAQGGEWNQVFVACPTRQNPRTADYFRWLYTAITRASEKLHLVNPPQVRLRVAGPVWWPESADRGAQGVGAPAPAFAPPASPPAGLPGGEPASPLEAFRHDVLDSVRTLLAETGIEIEDLAHYQYQEAFFLRRGIDAARVNVIYNGKFKITGVTVPPTNSFAQEARRILAPLAGQTPAAISPDTGDSKGPPPSPTRPFLRDFHDRLLPRLEARGIRVTSLQELQWSQRYGFARGRETAVVDIYYNGKNSFTKCVPIVPSGGPSTPPSLLREVVEILTSEIAP